jgi:alpha-beta hydrolase superfamily lysophospholipase
MESSNFRLRAADDVELFVYRWSTTQPPRAVVQIVHGLAEHAGRYARLAQALNAAGYAVYANDHRGHGKTAKSAEDLGFFAEQNGWQHVVDDLWQVNRHTASAHPGVPIVMLGHSMGSTLAEQFMGDHGRALAGAVLSGANGKPTAMATIGRQITRAERLRLGARGRSKLVQSLTFDAFNKKFAPTRTAFDWLSRDPGEVDKYVADPVCGFASSIQLWVDLLDGWAGVSREEHRRRVPRSLPIYVIAGGRDPVSGNARQIGPWIEDYRKSGCVNLKSRIYPEARHELLNETNRDQVTAELVEWLDSLVSLPLRSADAK